MGSYIFNGTSNKLVFDSFPVTTYPFTIGVWFEADNVTAAHTLATLGDTAGFTHYFRLSGRGDVTNDPIEFSANGNAANSTAPGFSANTWTSAVGVANSATSRASFRDGGSKGTNATSVTPSSIDRLTVGAFGRQTHSLWFAGHIGYVFVWSTNLSDAEVASWHGGTIPQSVSLVSAYDLTFDNGATIIDQIGANDLTITGASYDAATSPPVSYSFGSAYVPRSPALDMNM